MNRSLRKRMLFAYLLGTAVLVAGAAMALAGMNRVLAMYQKDVGSLQEARADSFLLLATFRMQLLEWHNVLMRGQDAGLRDKYWQAFEKQEKAVQERASRLLARLPPGDARRLVKNFADVHKQMGAAYRQGLNAFKAGSFDPHFGALAVAGADRLPSDVLDQAVEAVGKAVAENGRQAAGAARNALALGFALVGLLAVGGAGVFLIRVHYSILIPLRDLVGQVRRLARGEFGQPVTSFGGGELRDLAGSIEELRLRVAGLLERARHSSDTLAESSIELKSAAEAVIKNIEAGNESLSSLALATDRMVAAMRSVGIRTQAIHSSALTAAAKTRAGNATLRELTQGLSTVDRLMAQVSKSVSGFAVGTRDINGMTRKVQEIAERTKLLALNASIEAGQAGDRGRAFGVVAEEVRDLALSAARAAQDISVLTSRLNVYSREVEKVLQRGRARLTAGLAESQAADHLLLQAVEAVTAAAEEVSAVAESVRAQEAGIEEVSTVTVGFAADRDRNSDSVGRIRRVIDQLRRCTLEHHRQALAAAVH